MTYLYPRESSMPIALPGPSVDSGNTDGPGNGSVAVCGVRKTLKLRLLIRSFAAVDSCGRTHVIDVTIGDPIAATCLLNGSWNTELTVAQFVRDVKERKYYKAVPVLAHQDRFIPFAVESTSGLGNDASKFLKKRSFPLNYKVLRATSSIKWQLFVWLAHRSLMPLMIG